MPSAIRIAPDTSAIRFESGAIEKKTPCDNVQTQTEQSNTVQLLIAIEESHLIISINW